MPLAGKMTLTSPASVSDNLELPLNVSGESLALRFGIGEGASGGDWFLISQRLEVYLKFDPFSPFGGS